MVIDSQLSTTSENPVQNKVINNTLLALSNAINNLSRIAIVNGEANIPSADSLNEGDIVLVYEDNSNNNE